MIKENEHEEAYVTEAKEEAKSQAECLFEVIKEKAYELCVDLEWYTAEVIKHIKKAKEDSE